MAFDENVINYDRYRTRYVKELFDDLFAYSSCIEDSRVVEVGCGTGQATSWVLETGCTLTAIEIGKNLCDFTRGKYKNYPKFEVLNLPFEDYTMEESSIDMVFSASAFHWIPDDVGYPKIHNALKKGGCFAIIGCPVEVASENMELKTEIERLEREYFPQSDNIAKNGHDLMRLKFKKYSFSDIVHKQYSAFRELNADEYIGLMLSISMFSELSEVDKNSLFKKMHEVINAHGCIQIHDKIDLYVGRK